MDSDQDRAFQSSVLHYFLWKAEHEPLPDDMNRYQRLADQMQEDFPELGTPPPTWRQDPPELLAQIQDYPRHLVTLRKALLETRGRYNQLFQQNKGLQCAYNELIKRFEGLQRASLNRSLPVNQNNKRKSPPAAAAALPARAPTQVAGAPAVAPIQEAAPARAPVAAVAEPSPGKKKARLISESTKDRKTRKPSKKKKGPAFGPIKLDRHFTFDERFRQVQAFQSEHGHCNVPKVGTGADASLSKWVHDIRAVYQQCQRFPGVMKLGGSGPYYLDQERIARLESIGMDWNEKEKVRVPFECRFEQLLGYKAIHGNLRVSSFDKDFGELGHWVKMQRRHKREGKKTFLESERFHRLNAIGFEWKTRDEAKSFEERLQECRDFIKAHGHLNVPKLPTDLDGKGQAGKETAEIINLVGNQDETAKIINLVGNQDESSNGKPAAGQEDPAANGESNSEQTDNEDGDGKPAAKRAPGTVNLVGNRDDSSNSKSAAEQEVPTANLSTATDNDAAKPVGESNSGKTDNKHGDGKQAAIESAETVNLMGNRDESSDGKPVPAQEAPAASVGESNSGQTNNEDGDGKPAAKEAALATSRNEDDPQAVNAGILSKEEIDFRKWAQKMRTHYHKFNAFGPDRVLNSERVAKLNELGFVWGDPPTSKFYETALTYRDEVQKVAASEPGIHRPNEIIFLENVDKLKLCKEKYGTCMDRHLLSVMFPGDTTLLNWHQKLKKSYRDLQAGKTSYLTPRRVEKLKAVSYDFEGRHLNMIDRSKPKKPRKRPPGKTVQLAAAAMLDLGTGVAKAPPAASKAPPESTLEMKADSPTRTSARIQEKKAQASPAKKATSSQRRKRDKTLDESPRKKAKRN